MKKLITLIALGLFIISTQANAYGWSYESPWSALEYNPFDNSWDY